MKNIAYISTLMLSFFLLASCSEDTIDEMGTGSLTGTVVRQGTNEALEDVKISSQPASSTVFTDAEGLFSIKALTSGQYSIQAELEGFTTSFEAVSVTIGETSNVVFELSTSKANNKPPTAATLLSPKDGAVDVPNSVDFTWSSSANDEDLLTYTLELRNGSTQDIQQFEIEQDTTFNVSNLSLGTSYFWQISTSDNTNPTVISKVSQFKTVEIPNNPYLFTRILNGNSVIFSGNVNIEGKVVGELQLTSTSQNSFRPRKNNEVGKIAFLRTTGGTTHLFTMDLDGTGVQQVTSAIPINGFRLDELDFTWAQNGSKLYYPNFDKLYGINPDGGGAQLIYKTKDGSFISEVSAAQLNDDIIALKTNTIEGYDVRIFTVSLSSGDEREVILQNQLGAAGGLDLDANATRLLFTRDVSGSQNNRYRIFTSRLFIHDFALGTSQNVSNGVSTGENDLDPRWSPSEGEIIFTRVNNNEGAVPAVYSFDIDPETNNEEDNQLLFSNASQPDWE